MLLQLIKCRFRNESVCCYNLFSCNMITLTFLSKMLCIFSINTKIPSANQFHVTQHRRPLTLTVTHTQSRLYHCQFTARFWSFCFVLPTTTTTTVPAGLNKSNDDKCSDQDDFTRQRFGEYLRDECLLQAALAVAPMGFKSTMMMIKIHSSYNLFKQRPTSGLMLGQNLNHTEPPYF